MGIFNRFTKKKSVEPEVLNTEAPMVFYNANELLRSLTTSGGRIKTDTVLGQSKAFARAAIIGAILYEKVSAIKDARYWFFNDKGDEVTKPADMERVLHPNSYEDIAQFIAKVEFFSQLYGKAYIAKVDAVGMRGSFSLHVLPNPLIVENTAYNRDVEFAPRSSVVSYTVSLDGRHALKLSPEEVIEVYDVGYNVSKLGDSQSRLVALEEPVNTFISSYEATNELLTNRGMLGIISAKGQGASGVLFTKDEEDALLNKLEARYGIARGRAKYAVSSRDLAYIPISATIKDLGIGEIRENCKKDICYSYQIPSVILDVSGSTYSNYGEAKKKLYTSDIIPTANYFAKVLSTIYGFKGFHLSATFDHLDFFQESKRQQAAGMASLVAAINQATQSGLMSVEEGRQALLKYLTE